MVGQLWENNKGRSLILRALPLPHEGEIEKSKHSLIC